ncbi:uncharacterized protein LOC117170530 isoform X2 [Belonocnema kinseyi]|uniref:uncharacterized protein LOC117170530 isoform X2 n=1 Tax=Belonocnema kinseyi TaxID=2817044 RepID=UPI00143D7243|nr:uncharacterized protein LOC117170530 isoform X2 [Belonocnema kinseyi]
MDLLSKLEQRSESESHQESSPQTQSTGEGLPETELHLHINPQTLSTEQRISRTTSYLQAQPQIHSQHNHRQKKLTSYPSLNKEVDVRIIKHQVPRPILLEKDILKLNCIYIQIPRRILLNK